MKIDNLDELFAAGSLPEQPTEHVNQSRPMARAAAAVREQTKADTLRRDELRNLGIYTPQTLGEAVKSEAGEPYLIEGLLRTRSLNVLVGDSGLGKTPLGIQVGVCVAAGLPFFGLKVSQQGPVLYCDAESDSSTFQEMLSAVSHFLGLSQAPADFHVWSPNWESHVNLNEASASWATKLFSRVRVVEPRLVIVDPLRMFWPEAESTNEETVRIIASLRKVSKSTGCSWLITHHRRKLNQQTGVAHLEDQPHAWFQEAAGAHALINQTDTRLGVVPHSGQADLLLAGFVRGTGPFTPLDLARVTDTEGTPVGYRLLTGIEHLAEGDRTAGV